jgi:hypothetical protein
VSNIESAKLCTNVHPEKQVDGKEEIGRETAVRGTRKNSACKVNANEEIGDENSKLRENEAKKTKITKVEIKYS